MIIDEHQRIISSYHRDEEIASAPERAVRKYVCVYGATKNVTAANDISAGVR